MSNISGSDFADTLRWSKEDPASAKTKKDDAMTQEDFFSLLTTQLAAQDPTKPTDNDQMIAQMTNFTMADGIGNLQTQFETFTGQFGGFMESMQGQQTSNKALQASSMVGREVLVESEQAPLFQFAEDSFGMAGQAMFETAHNDIKVKITTEAGRHVATVDLGASEKGPINFTWDGKDSEGNQMPADIYNISATGIDSATKQRAPITLGTYSTVDSVRFGNGNDLSMNVRGIGSYSMDQIIEVAP